MTLNNNIKLSWSAYWQQTPKKIKQLGLFLMAISGAAGTCGLVFDQKWLVYIGIIGAAGKFLTTFMGYIGTEDQLDSKIKELSDKMAELKELEAKKKPAGEIQAKVSEVANVVQETKELEKKVETEAVVKESIKPKDE